MRGVSEYLEPTDNCPNCEHPLDPKVHGRSGCLTDWAWNDNGLPLIEGCLCNLMLAQ